MDSTSATSGSPGSQSGGTPSNNTLYLVSLNHATNDGSASLIPTLFPVILELGFSYLQIGIIVAVGYLINVICQPMVGRFSESFEPRYLLAAGISLIGLSMAVFTLSHTFPVVLVSVIILRVGSSVFHPVGISAISRSYRGTKLDYAMGYQSAFGNFGILTVFLVSAPLNDFLGTRSLFVLFAALDFMVVGITLVSMRRTLPLSPGGGAESVHLASAANSLEPQRGRFGLPLFFITTMLISGGSYAAFVNYGNILLHNSSFNLVDSNLMVSMWIASSFAGAISTGMLTKIMSRSKLLTLSYVVASVTALTFALFAAVVPIALASLVLNGFFLSITYPAIYADLSSFLGVDSKKKGSSFGILFSAQVIGSVAMGFAGGYVIGVTGNSSLPFFGASALLLAAFAFTVLWNRSEPASSLPPPTEERARL